MEASLGLEWRDIGTDSPYELFVAEEHARERVPSCFWSMTTPTEVKSLAKGMNHAHPDSSKEKLVLCSTRYRRPRTAKSFKEGRILPVRPFAIHSRATPVSPDGYILQR